MYDLFCAGIELVEPRLRETGKLATNANRGSQARHAFGQYYDTNNDTNNYNDNNKYNNGDNGGNSDGNGQQHQPLPQYVPPVAQPPAPQQQHSPPHVTIPKGRRGSQSQADSPIVKLFDKDGNANTHHGVVSLSSRTDGSWRLNFPADDHWGGKDGQKNRDKFCDGMCRRNQKNEDGTWTLCCKKHKDGTAGCDNPKVPNAKIRRANALMMHPMHPCNDTSPFVTDKEFADYLAQQPAPAPPAGLVVPPSALPVAMLMLAVAVMVQCAPSAVLPLVGAFAFALTSIGFLVAFAQGAEALTATVAPTPWQWPSVETAMAPAAASANGPAMVTCVVAVVLLALAVAVTFYALRRCALNTNEVANDALLILDELISQEVGVGAKLRDNSPRDDPYHEWKLAHRSTTARALELQEAKDDERRQLLLRKLERARHEKLTELTTRAEAAASLVAASRAKQANADLAVLNANKYRRRVRAFGRTRVPIAVICAFCIFAGADGCIYNPNTSMVPHIQNVDLHQMLSHPGPHRFTIEAVSHSYPAPIWIVPRHMPATDCYPSPSTTARQYPRTSHVDHILCPAHRYDPCTSWSAVP
jgi:hypothetical protein